MHKLKLLQWNAQGATTQSVITQIELILNVESVDMAFISETYLSAAHNFKLTNYVIYRNDRLTHGGGVLIAVRKNIEHKLIRSYDTAVAENISIQATVGKSPIIFTSVYVPRYSKDFKNDINKMTPSGKDFVVLGDFNAKHLSWNCTANNRAGKVLFNMLHTSNFIMHHPNAYTHFPHCGSVPSTIDFAITNSNCIFTHVYTLEGKLPSDHNPVIFHVEGCLAEKIPAARPNYKKADWNKYENFIADRLNVIESSTLNNETEIDLAILEMVNLIKSAEAVAVPTERANSTCNRKISAETIRLIKLRNNTKRLWQRCSDDDLKPVYKSQVNAQNKAIKVSIKQDFNKKWDCALKSAKPGDSKLWSLSKKMMKAPKNRIEMLNDNGRISTSDEEIAESLAERFVMNHSTTIDFRHQVDSRVAKVVKVIDDIRPSSLINAENRVDLLDIQRIVSKLKVKKAPGLDKISNVLLKRLPVSALVQITRIINASIDICHFPSHFKIAKITPVLKSMKDPKCAVNYRPISLLSSLGKIFERLINLRLTKFIHENEIVNPKQFGFREGHSTTHQIKRLLNIISDNKTQRKTTGMVLLDIEKAFDSVWHDGLIFKLHSAGIPIALIKLVASFLRDRSFTVTVNGTNSSHRHIPAGLPQGSVISPILYAIFTSDLKIPKNCDAGYYADDTAIIAAGKQSNSVIRSLAIALTRIDKYFKKWRIKVNNDKTQAILFKFNQSRKRIPTHSLIFNGSVIEIKNEVKYLGVTLDHKLKFGRHIDESQRKSLNCFRSLYPLLCRKSKLSTENKLILYKSIIRPRLMYASPVWKNSATIHLNKLQLVQNKILKCIHGVSRRFPTKILHEISNVKLIKEKVLEESEAFAAKCVSSRFDLIRHLAG